MGRLERKVALITGGAAGIGRASAQLFCAEGAKVIIADVNEADGTAVAEELSASGHDAVFVPLDVTDDMLVKRACDTAAEKFGGIHILLNCAGGSIAADKAVTDVDLNVWDHTMNLDLRGTFLVCRHTIPHLRAAGGGSIVNFTSIVALRGSFRGHVYTAAKGGIISFTQALAGKYWRDSIRANAIAPGVILSDRIRERMDVDAEDSLDEQISAAMTASKTLIDERHPLGYGVPEDIANVALFLASDESRMVNGAVIPAEGGAAAY